MSTPEDDRFVDLPAGPRLCYRVDGPADGVPLLLIAGLGIDLTSWPKRMVEGFTAAGFRVLRFDNRDIGRSGRIDTPPPGRVRQLLARPRPDAYDLTDMAADTVGLLDHLGIDRVHLVGMSMGGMIAQTVAARHPARVASLTSIFSTTGHRRILGINLFGVIHGTKAFLPHLIASGDGHVVNVSSLNGVLAQAGINAYSASKFGVRGFTEALRSELLMAGHPVQVSVVHPGGVRTNIATAAFAEARGRGLATPEDEARLRVYNEKLLRMPPERAARIVVDGVEAGRPRILVGNDAKAVDLLVRLLPSRYPAIVARIAAKRAGG